MTKTQKNQLARLAKMKNNVLAGYNLNDMGWNECPWCHGFGDYDNGKTCLHCISELKESE